MKVIVGINHPKQVHMFKNLMYTLEKNGHEYLVVVNDKEITCELLDSYKIKYVKIGYNKSGILKKILQSIALTLKTISISIGFKPDIFVGQAILHIAFTSFLFRKPYIIFEDTESSKHLQKVVNPFASVIVTPDSYWVDKSSLIKIKGGFELAYLRPNVFTPDKNVLNILGVADKEFYTIIRFVSWNANHDIGHSGISESNKLKLVKEFEKYGKVFISSEAPLPKELETYQYSIPPELMHHALFFCSLVFGESASMAAEAAYLGTPAIYLDNVGRGYTDKLEKIYGLVYNFTESSDDQINAINKGIELLKNRAAQEKNHRRQQLLNDTIDVNGFMYWFVTDYPKSKFIMKETSDYQNKFT